MNTSDARYDESATEQRLSGALSALADWPQPPSGVSIEAVVGAGRRGVRRRRRAAALGTAAVFAAAAIGAWGAVDNPPARTTASVGPDLWGQALQGQDPMVPLASFGWLPGPPTGGFAWSLTKHGDFTISDEPGTVNVSLTLQAVGEPELGGSHASAGTVEGQPAVWISDTSGPRLTWQYEPGAWAVLLAEGATNAQATRIANGLRFGTQDPMTMPFHLPALPKGFTVGAASALRNTQSASVQGDGSVTLCANASGCSTKLYLYASNLGPSNQLDLLFRNNTSAGDSAKSSTVKIHGVAAQYAEIPDGTVSVNFSINGLYVTAQASGAAVKAIGGRDGLVKYLDSITWYGKSPSGWTTDVIG